MSGAAQERFAPALSPHEVERLQQRLLDWYARNARDLPWRRTTDPYAILVSEVMLQQTQVPRVVPKFEAWLDRFATLEALSAAPLADVLLAWQGLGYNSRARRLRECALVVIGAATGTGAAALPTSLEGLRALPGIGPYTARAVLVFAHNADVAAVDANVRRVLTHELSLPSHLDERTLQRVAEVVLPRGRSRDWHNALMDYGSTVLTSRATGIAPRTRQTPFEGSRRQRRARLLRVLLAGGPATLDGLATALRLPAAEVADLCVALERDGLVGRSGEVVAVAGTDEQGDISASAGRRAAGAR
jgi:A/G-specific adenine glycosylase